MATKTGSNESRPPSPPTRQIHHSMSFWELQQMYGIPCEVIESASFVVSEPKSIESPPPPPPPTTAPASPSRSTTTIKFTGFPDDSFRCSVQTDKLETSIELESTKRHDKWQCRLDDEALAKCAPDGVKLPRSAIARILMDVMDALAKNGSSPHSVDFTSSQSSTSTATLALTLGIVDEFRPVYTFELKSVQLSENEKLRAKAANLEAELADLKLHVKRLETQLEWARELAYFH